MMSDPTTIDYLAHDQLRGKYVLVIREDRRWTHQAEMHAQLKAKVDTYFQYIMDGGVTQEYPSSSCAATSRGPRASPSSSTCAWSSPRTRSSSIISTNRRRRGIDVLREWRTGDGVGDGAGPWGRQKIFPQWQCVATVAASAAIHPSSPTAQPASRSVRKLTTPGPLPKIVRFRHPAHRRPPWLTTTTRK